ncbi:MAG: transposase [Pyrinomonadaceae bacterium]|nr:transposase [Sphingobacteriaceae bacterium]
MSDKGYQIRNQHAVHFITFGVVQWVDIFNRKEYADIVVESLKFCQAKKGLRIHAWCIMSNHVHLIISSAEHTTLSDCLRDLKKFTSVKILDTIENNTKESRRNWMLWLFKKAGEANSRNDKYQFWQQDNHPIECSDYAILKSRLKYLHENPIRARLVRFEQDYIYSSGIDYYTEQPGLIKIDFI